MKFFISYANEDDSWAKWIVWELESCKARHNCIVQFRDFSPGESFTGAMRIAMDQADCTLALFSKAYFRSGYCNQELNAALTAELLPVRVAECDPGTYLRNRIYIDLIGIDVASARERLLSGVDAYVLHRHKSEDRHFYSDRPEFPGGPAAQPIPTESTAVAPPARGPIKVAFLGSDLGGLDPQGQLTQMEAYVKRSRYPGALRFTSMYGLSVNGLFEALNREAPQILHISGKQNGGDVLMKDGSGALTRVSDNALAGMFRSLDGGLKLVVMDTCYSLPCATTIAKAVPAAIGVEGAIYESDAIRFYGTFYQALAAGRSLQDSITQARFVLESDYVAEEEIPQLCCGAGVDPATVVLIDAAAFAAAGNR